LSLRQRLLLEDFAPFVVISIPLIVKVFFNSYRVRLPMHRKYHNIAFSVVFIFLFVNLIVSYFNKPLYYIIKESNKHIAYKYHIAKDLATILKEKNIKNINVNDKKLELRLKFYGIKDGGTYKLSRENFKTSNFEKIDIKYFGKVIESFYIL